MLSRAAAAAAAKVLRPSTPLLRSLSTAVPGATPAAAEATSVTLNFCLPHEAIYSGASVFQVILPGLEGEYGITVNHVPYVAQLKPGVVQIIHSEGGPSPEKYFVPGGYALTHPNSVTDVVCPDAAKLEDIDPAVVTRQYETARDVFARADGGSKEAAEAQIDMDVNKAMGLAIGVSLG